MFLWRLVSPSSHLFACLIPPGAIETERTKAETADYAETWGPLTPLRRIGKPDDVADAVTYLAADSSSFITGQTLSVDGARAARHSLSDEQPACTTHRLTLVSRVACSGGLMMQCPWPYEYGFQHDGNTASPT